MRFLDVIVCFSIAISAISAAAADSIRGCGGFVEASRSLIKSRKQSDPKLDYSHITVELRTVDGLVKDRTQCAPNGYYFIPVYDKGSFVIKIKGPEGWSWDPANVPVVIDQNGCNGNADINFRFTGFTLSGRVVGAVGGESCLSKEGGPSNVKVELLSLSDDVISSVFTSSVGGYSFTNIIPDNPLECLISLPTTRKIAMKNKIIFGTGDNWRAPTLTTNMGFVRAILQTGMSLLTLEHRPRALIGD